MDSGRVLELPDEVVADLAAADGSATYFEFVIVTAPKTSSEVENPVGWAARGSNKLPVLREREYSKRDGIYGEYVRVYSYDDDRNSHGVARVFPRGVSSPPIADRSDMELSCPVCGMELETRHLPPRKWRATCPEHGETTLSFKR